MRTRRSARLLILNASHAVLLFRFVHKQEQDALAGYAYFFSITSLCVPLAICTSCNK